MARRVVAPLGADRDGGPLRQLAGTRCSNGLPTAAGRGERPRRVPPARRRRDRQRSGLVRATAQRSRGALPRRRRDDSESSESFPANRHAGRCRPAGERVPANDVRGRLPVDVGVRGRRRLDRRSRGVSPTTTSQLLAGTFRVAEWPRSNPSKISSKKLTGTSWIWPVPDGHGSRERPAQRHHPVLDGHSSGYS
jgi:hypothetical protein